MSNVQEVNGSDFDSEVLQSSMPVLVDFWATWCGPCRKLSPAIDEIAETFKGKLKVVKINADENRDIIQDNSISGLPTLIIFKDGKAVERMVGFMPKSNIINNVEKYL